MSIGQVRVLTLNKGDNLETTLFRLQKGWSVHFMLGPTLLTEHVRIYCNHPVSPDTPFDRTVYRELPWDLGTKQGQDRSDMFAELPIWIAGSFHFYFTIGERPEEALTNGQGYFLVDPHLLVGVDDHRLLLDAVQCQTVLAKCLGPFEEWESRLRVSKESGYNMIHFTPLQELGVSKSSYSLKNQHLLNPTFSINGKYTMTDVENLIEHMKNDWGVLSMADLVFNHTAVNSDWVAHHPECTYNLLNCPYLRPAYVLDRVFYYFSREVASGNFEFRCLPSKVRNEDHLKIMKNILIEKVFPSYKFEEFYQLDVPATVKAFKSKVLGGAFYDPTTCQSDDSHLVLVQDPMYGRLQSTVDMNLALKLYNVDRPGAKCRDDRIKMCCDDLQGALEQLNKEAADKVHEHLTAAIDHFIANARYRFVDPSGPRYEVVSEKNPLMHQYFYCGEKTGVSVQRDEADLTIDDVASHVMACNGWVMGDDPLKNFAEPDSNVYLRRELVVWGDSVKLRYGQQPSDCPYLWDHMLRYAVETARVFHAVRLDNCHSTPLCVAEYMLDAARKVRPDLWVVAELFTNSDHTDNIFINRLGINSLIREALNAWDSHEQGRLVYRYGGEPVGAFIQPRVRPLTPTVAHALFYDMTHDNPSPIKKRSVYDLLPTGAMVSAACCATGSSRSYDELVPHHVHVVDETRLYCSWTDYQDAPRGTVHRKTGIIDAKRAINNLHTRLGQTGFNQVFVDQVDYNTVAITRHNPGTHESVIIVSRTAFHHPENAKETGHVPPISFPGNVDEIIYESRLVHPSRGAYAEDPMFINGLCDFDLYLREGLTPEENTFVSFHDAGNHYKRMEFRDFTPGSTIAIRVSMPEEILITIKKMRYIMQQLGCLFHSSSSLALESADGNCLGQKLKVILDDLTLVDLNRVLFRCDPEERDDGKGIGAYNIPNYGPLTYCGLQGIMSLMSRIRATNDLGHPVCCNLRDGNWYVDYTASRLTKHPGTKELGKWLENVLTVYKAIPHYLRPSYFDAFMAGFYTLVLNATWHKLGSFVSEGTSFVKLLALGSVQFCSVVRTAHLPCLSPNIGEPRPPTDLDEERNEDIQMCPTLAAGFEHFASGLMRNWGRDTFIALRGLLLLTGRFEEARYIILGFAGCLRHGLIPNLLGEGVVARYNCRDAIWWWMQSIQDYCSLKPDGEEILQDKVLRLYPNDEELASEPEAKEAEPVEQPLFEVIQEAVQKHASGLEFRERNAGPQLDVNMSDEGFTNQIGVWWDTGLVHGGTVHNCGTWMDKMGSSRQAENWGKPATPRDGAAVEIVGLCKSAVRWLMTLNKNNIYPYPGVTATVNGENVEVTFKEWNKKLEKNFEKCFWVHSRPRSTESNPELINKRGIYKDTYFATQFWANTQLRPNYTIAMVVAPEMFNADHAWLALTRVEEHLLGPLGLKTLDPDDWAYHGDYVNSDDSSDPKVAHGFNYHNGPEWLWPMGFFLRAKLYFAKILDQKHPGLLKSTLDFVQSVLSRHQIAIQSSDWKSLPELTNDGGKECADGCKAQAWSVACILEVVYDLKKL